MQLNGPLWQHSETVAAGAASLIYPPTGGDIGLAVAPAALGTALVEYTLAPVDEVKAGSAAVRWFNWSPGFVTAQATDIFAHPVSALRITATAQPCRVEFSQRGV